MSVDASKAARRHLPEVDWPRPLLALREHFVPANGLALRSVTYPAASSVHKRGIFASRDLLPGEIFGIGVTHGPRDYARILDGFGPCPVHSACFLLCIGDRSQHINHRIDPNIAFIKGADGFIFARILQRIARDSELFADYGPDFTAFNTRSSLSS